MAPTGQLQSCFPTRQSNGRTRRPIQSQDGIPAADFEHLRGRRLLIGTTNLDAQRLVIWDMGAIAASGHPKALDLLERGVRLLPAALVRLDCGMEFTAIPRDRAAWGRLCRLLSLGRLRAPKPGR